MPKFLLNKYTFSRNISCLQDDVDDDDKERIGEVVQEPDFNRFDDWSAGETVGHGQVD